MSTYKLKSVVRRGTLLGAAFALFAAAVVPGLAYADALNPLTDRSLTLSSSAPGWDFTDGSGNTTFAQPNSGANGQKTGNTFEFKVSTDSSTDPLKAVKGFSFQYCTTSAGTCRAPGDNQYDTSGGAGAYTRELNEDNVDANIQRSDLEVVAPSATEMDNVDYLSLFNQTAGVPTTIPNRDGTEGSFVVLYKDVGDSSWTQSEDWSMTAANVEDGSVADGLGTETNNMIYLVNSGTGLTLESTGSVKIIFFGTDDNYITNPGSGAFFVKINDYSADDSADFDDTTLIDGGVTVANVMNRSISIQTKVLETMDFSVGTVDPYTLASGAGSQLATASGRTTHGQCNPILTRLNPADPVNTLLLGDTEGENSLSTAVTYSTHSYWRLSSNSSAGATVYYSGVTLQNTVGDEIQAIGTTAMAPQRGTPQFGLALANGTRADHGLIGQTPSTLDDPSLGLYPVNYGTEVDASKGVYENGADNAASGLTPGQSGGAQGVHSSVATDIATAGLTGYHAPRLWPLIPGTEYDSGAGSVNGDSGEYGTVNTKFAFDDESNLIPAAIASEDSQVVDCVTAKVRYVANIAATTPAGIYTTKINYIAAPQY